MLPTTRSTASRSLRVAVLTAAAAVAVAACSPSGPPTIASPLGTLVQTDAAGALPLEKTFDVAQTALVGPHFAFAVGGAQFAKNIDAAKAAELGLEGPLTAPPGYEVMTFQISPEYTAEAALSGRDGATAALELGDRTVDLDEVPEPGELIVAMAQEGAPAKLVVTDAGKRFSVNLRDGVHEEFVPALLVAPTLSSYGNAGPYDQEVKAETDEWIITFGTGTEFQLARTAWAEGYEWAPDGKLWIEVQFTFQHLWKGKNVDIDWVLDPAKSLTLKVGDSTVKATKTETGEKQNQMIAYSMVFEVAPETAAVDIVFKPSGDIKVIDGSKKLKPKITKAPKEKKYTVEF
ncbi:hypothetical protein [Phytomonospora endophytica]|uniref:Lipoprotein n=1 Tax=Phytomonospora endophytica TaxID=714109 RepID=A0A841F6M6_9ACTN|nr:hypothetical protein [Phytomonospora endophytica]MBB6032601.1 hypothetical protein [Phytomonospora endophytica]GIG66249.1 hypothetical protein Pen01_25440 [Phytomonospora endophytica]